MRGAGEKDDVMVSTGGWGGKSSCFTSISGAFLLLQTQRAVLVTLH
jgi:hypothetical protein